MPDSKKEIMQEENSICTCSGLDDSVRLSALRGGSSPFLIKISGDWNDSSSNCGKLSVHGLELQNVH